MRRRWSSRLEDVAAGSAAPRLRRRHLARAGRVLQRQFGTRRRRRRQRAGARCGRGRAGRHRRDLGPGKPGGAIGSDGGMAGVPFGRVRHNAAPGWLLRAAALNTRDAGILAHERATLEFRSAVPRGMAQRWRLMRIKSANGSAVHGNDDGRIGPGHRFRSGDEPAACVQRGGPAQRRRGTVALAQAGGTQIRDLMASRRAGDLHRLRDHACRRRAVLQRMRPAAATRRGAAAPWRAALARAAADDRAVLRRGRLRGDGRRRRPGGIRRGDRPFLPRHGRSRRGAWRASRPPRRRWRAGLFRLPDGAGERCRAGGARRRSASSTRWRRCRCGRGSAWRCASASRPGSSSSPMSPIPAIPRNLDVFGETPNLAARLQALAEPGTALLSDSVKRQVGALFEIRDLGAHPMKGWPDPVPVWQVLGVSRSVDRFAARAAGSAAADARPRRGARPAADAVALGPGGRGAGGADLGRGRHRQVAPGGAIAEGSRGQDRGALLRRAAPAGDAAAAGPAADRTRWADASVRHPGPADREAARPAAGPGAGGPRLDRRAAFPARPRAGQRSRRCRRSVGGNGCCRRCRRGWPPPPGCGRC